MSAATGVRTPKAPRRKDFRPGFADHGTVLFWESDRTGADPERLGEVWSAGPGTGTRWVLDESDYVLVKVGMSGRLAGQVHEIARRDSAWQRRMVRALDTLSRAQGIQASDEDRPYSGDWTDRTYRVTTYHVEGCERAERYARGNELNVRHPDGTVTHPSTARGYHQWLLAHLANVHSADRLPLCECITGEPAESAAA